MRGRHFQCFVGMPRLTTFCGRVASCHATRTINISEPRGGRVLRGVPPAPRRRSFVRGLVRFTGANSTAVLNELPLSRARRGTGVLVTASCTQGVTLSVHVVSPAYRSRPSGGTDRYTGVVTSCCGHCSGRGKARFIFSSLKACQPNR